ncbi:Piso0_005032 [Millerozyma farinosa CBS 7064]|uniref:DNA helicase n=1 Tax=Pichia sorbitophila (strain ATCC MYA-4447 / BCRC 22081 / CBS 7064 / NBRC 10061 / NRRL Y-12695) TaxID=559304 RepID=G8Y418_PICSO|nr:Piso0_005032 [Millerozyma farinosa CBS 7064]
MAEKENQEQFVSGFKQLVDIEQKADALLTNEYLNKYSPKKLQKYGLAATNLVVKNARNGLGGNTVLELCLDSAVKAEDQELDSGDLKVGDIVRVEKMKSSQEQSSSQSKDSKQEDEMNSYLDAVITKITSSVINVAVSENNSGESIINLYNNTQNEQKVWLVKLSNSVTYKRMISTLNKLGEVDIASSPNQVIQYLLGFRTLDKTDVGIQKLKDKDFFNQSLNESQKEAINFSLFESPFSIIHGPPGTGKTYTLIEIIKQLSLKQNERVLVCGPSNVSVDTILERLALEFDPKPNTKEKRSKGQKKSGTRDPSQLIRIGHPARLLDSCLKHSLEVLSKSDVGSGNDSRAILKDIENDINDTLRKIKKCRNYGERRVLWNDLKGYRKELKKRETKLVSELVVGAKVILATLHGSGGYDLTSVYKNPEFASVKDGNLFDTIIIDEVSQSLEPQCWIPLISHLGFKRLIIAGDNLQLPPTVKSSKLDAPAAQGVAVPAAARHSLEVTLFDRIVRECNGDAYKKLLDTQYRMNDAIMAFPSRELYEGKLKADSSVKNILLRDMPNVQPTDETSPPCLWYDTQGGDYPEQMDDSENPLTDSMGSKYNEMELLAVKKHIDLLIAAGVAPRDIGVISPYAAQVARLRKALAAADLDAVEAATIDAFQGREKEAIIISLVRSNDDRAVGFLSEKRRLNVAMTRPKRHLCVVGDMDLMSRSDVPFLRHWAAHVESSYEILYPDLGDY